MFDVRKYIVESIKLVYFPMIINVIEINEEFKNIKNIKNKRTIEIEIK